MSIFIELAFSLFDAVLCVYFISRFNDASLSIRKNRVLLPAILTIFGFSIINDLFLVGFSVLGTIIFLCLYIAYALLISNKRYVRAIVSACIFEIVFVLLSSLLYLIISLLISDYEQLMQGSSGAFRYLYVAIHKIALFVILKFILMAFKSKSKIELKHGIVSLIFSFTTILGLGATMYLSSKRDSEAEQIPVIMIALAFALCNLILYLLIYQVQKHKEREYELKLLNEKISHEKSGQREMIGLLEKTRKLQHDMRLHLSVINECLAQNEIERCKKYVSELLPSIGKNARAGFSQNSILDYLISLKLLDLPDTEVIISGSIGDLSDINDVDLASLMGNILDNAVEAISKIRKGKKRIELLFLRQNANRVIICKNTIAKSVLRENSELRTTKEPKSEHGYGTKIIAKIVSEYGGMVDYFEEYNMFGIQVILPEPN